MTARSRGARHGGSGAAGVDFWREYQSEFIERTVPNWREMGYNQGRLCSHIAQRAWIPDWPEDGLWSDWKAYARYTKGRPGADAAATVAVLLGREAPFLVDWEPARLLSAEWDSGTKTLTARLDSQRDTSVTIGSRDSLVSVTVDGAEVPFAPERCVVRVGLPAGGHEVRWCFGARSR